MTSQPDSLDIECATMKPAFTRVLIAAVLALFHMAAFQQFSLPAFIAVWAFWTLPLQSILIVQNILYNRRLRLQNVATKPLPVPDTRPFDKPL